MLKNIFDSINENNNDLLFQKPDQKLLNAIIKHDAYVDKFEKNTKIIAIIFVITMAVLWIVGDLIGIPSAFVLAFGLLAIFGYPLIFIFGLIWINRPAMRRVSAELSTQALAELNVPEDAVEIELLYPKKLSESGNDVIHKKGMPADNQMQLAYADAEALYLADVTGTVKIPYALMEPWNESTGKLKIRNWIQDSHYSSFKSYGVQKKSKILSLIPGISYIGIFIPDSYLIPCRYSIIHTVKDDYLLCIPVYEADKLHAVIDNR